MTAQPNAMCVAHFGGLRVPTHPSMTPRKERRSGIERRACDRGTPDRRG